MERLLLKILNSGMTNESVVEEESDVFGEREGNILEVLQSSAKLHIAFLSISLIIGLAFGGYIVWKKKDVFHVYIINLVGALVCRTFFTILFDGVVILGGNFNPGGANALISIECLCQNLVYGFFLLLTIYIHARLQRNFNSEPTLTLYLFGIPGVALFFAFVYIFTLQSEFPSLVWGLAVPTIARWIVNSLRLLFLLIQLGLLGDMGRMMITISLDNDSVSLLRKSAAMICVLVILFWLQFGLETARRPLLNAQAFQNFDYFVDGSHCGLVCVVLYFFNQWVEALGKMPSLEMERETTSEGLRNERVEALVERNRPIVTIDSIVSKRKNWVTFEDSTDVVYSNVVQPDRLKKTIDLYKRMNVIPEGNVTVFDEDKFYDCQRQNSFKWEDGNEEEFKSLNSSLWDSFKTPQKNEIKLEPPPKKNAFYCSKYLIVDPKESRFPKYLDTRPSIDKEESHKKDISVDPIKPNDWINKWLQENVENMQNKSGSPQQVDLKIVPNDRNKSEEEQKKKLIESFVDELKNYEKTDKRSRQENVEIIQNKVPKDEKVWNKPQEEYKNQFIGILERQSKISNKIEKPSIEKEPLKQPTEEKIVAPIAKPRTQLANEWSSDSEFGVENKNSSSSSGASFHVEDYYAKVMESRDKIKRSGTD